MQDKELLFIGKITAGVTHEINNVLAVIKESSGLMGDILTFRKKSFFSFLKKKDEEDAYHQKFLDIVSTIAGQVARGVNLIKSLNRFAHSMDEPLVLIDVNATAELMAFLLQRFVRPKRVSLEASPSREAVNINTSPIGLQMVLASLIEYHLREIEAGGRIILGPAKTDRGVAVEVLALGDPQQAITGKEYAEGPRPGLDDLKEMLQAINGRLSAVSGPGLKGTLLDLEDQK